MTYVERCLWEYRANCAMLKELRYELKALMSVRGHSYEAHTMNGTSDPVSEVTNKILNLEKKIARTERYTRPVRKLQENLCGSDYNISQMNKLLKLRYFRHKSQEDVQKAMGISQATFWRRTRELLRMAKKYFAEKE